jgi:tetratricopeptide (TPR) repeat protein/predicted Ser/Thr protein kinase
MSDFLSNFKKGLHGCLEAPLSYNDCVHLGLPLLLFVSGKRQAAGLLAFCLLLWLHWGWLAPLVGLSSLPLPPAPFSPWVQGPAHLLVLLLLLAALGLFSPRPGSPKDLALRAQRRGDHLAAGEFYLQAGKPRKAIRAFIKARAWARAGDTARNLGKLGKAARFYERQGGPALALAAQLYARSGDEGRARDLWQRLGQDLVQRGEPQSAIEPFLKAGDVKRAVTACQLALQEKKLSPATAEVALEACRRGQQLPLAAQVASFLGRHGEAGELFLAAGLPSEAAQAFERAGETARAAEAWRLAGEEAKAARLKAHSLAQSGLLAQAAEELAAAGLHQEAAQVLLRLGRYKEAFQRLLLAGLKQEAAQVAVTHLDPLEGARLLEELEDWEGAGRAWEKAGDLRAAARCFERAGELQRVLEIYGALGLVGEQARILALLGHIEEAFLVLHRAGDLQGAWELLSRYGGVYPSLAPQLLELAQFLRRQDKAAAVSALQRATAGMPTSAELLPLLYTQAELLEEMGDLPAAQAILKRIVEFDYGFRDAAARLQALRQARRAPMPSPGGGPPTPVPQDASQRYVLEQELGRGGMGIVYRAKDTKLGRTVAIKILHPRQHTPEALRRFEREARAAAALSHPGIVHIYDFGQGFGSSFLVMEFVAGPTLHQLLKDDPAFLRANLLKLMLQAAEAVGYAHDHHVVHRDLKPANFILADRKQLKILDFGIARRLDELDLGQSGVTGTPYYMAPEQILNEQPDERSDVYSLGVTFFQLATGTLPFPSGNVIKAHLEQAPPDPQALNPELEPALCHLILRCLEKDPNKRPRDGNALAAALRLLMEERKR